METAATASTLIAESTTENAWLNDDDDNAVPDDRFAPLVAMATEKAHLSEKSSSSVKIKRMALAMTLPALAGDDDEFGINDAPLVAMTTAAPEQWEQQMEAAVAMETAQATPAAAAAPVKPKKKKRVVVEAGGQSDFDLITNLLGGTSDLVDVVDEADAYANSTQHYSLFN